MTEGWKCPVCGKGVAPWKAECEHGNGTVTPYQPRIWPTTTEPIGPNGDPWHYITVCTSMPGCNTEQ